MYNCKTIKDLLLTDYTDKEIDAAARSQVDLHLSQCAACQEFAKEVKQNLVMPLEKAGRMDVPEYVWNQIREKIHTEEYSKATFVDKIADWFKEISLPRLMPALGTFAVLVLLASSVLLNQFGKETPDEDTGINLTEMLTLTAVAPQAGGEPGTPIEKYFL